jgi:hypothetical protein
MHAIRPYPKPRWAWLYGIVTLLGGLLTVVEVAVPDGVARRTLGFSVVLAMLATMALWVRTNRVALALANEAHPARHARPTIESAARQGGAAYNRAWPWTTGGVIPKRSWPAPARKKRASTAAS